MTDFDDLDFDLGRLCAGAGSGPHGAAASQGLWVEIPQGYDRLPLTDVDATVGIARDVMTELAPPDLAIAVGPVADALAAMLTDLAARDVLYCGVGRHRSATDDSLVTSVLTVSLTTFPDRRNPRLILNALLQAEAAAAGDGDRESAELVEFPRGPVLFLERLLTRPAPQIPGQPEMPADATGDLYQMQALIPAPDGSQLAAVEVSTSFVAAGPQFRTMVATLAVTTSFTAPQTEMTGVVVP